MKNKIKVEKEDNVNEIDICQSPIGRLEISKKNMQEEYTYPYQNLSLADMEGEVWKDVPDYEGYYQISNMGRIKSLERIYFSRNRYVTKKERILKQQISTSKKTKIRNIVNKQLHVTLYVDGTATRIAMSRLMYTTFVKPLTPKKLVSYHDEDRFNNKPENLYTVTFKELGKRNIQTGKTKAPTVNLQSIKKAHNVPVSKYDKNGKYICSYKSMAEAASLENIYPSSISSVCFGKRRFAGGFIWKYMSSEKSSQSVKNPVALSDFRKEK